ncbi:MAG TPA: hypothetical protein VGX28_03485 [Frankiaceae bacterium]|jgi:hypothetical protein|nr:hypothetical protein [Frankiaceae bacterium]
MSTKLPDPDPYAEVIPLLKKFHLIDFSYDRRTDRRIKRGMRQRLIDEYEEARRRREARAARLAAETVADTEARAAAYRATRARAARPT